MPHLVYLLPALACPVGMGAMMWLMMRGGGKSKELTLTGTTTPGPMNAQQAAEIAQLREEIKGLRSDADGDLQGSDQPISRR